MAAKTAAFSVSINQKKCLWTPGYPEELNSHSDQQFLDDQNIADEAILVNAVNAASAFPILRFPPTDAEACTQRSYWVMFRP